MPDVLRHILDELYARINCYGVGQWLEDLFKGLGVAPPDPGLPPDIEQSTPQR